MKSISSDSEAYRVSILRGNTLRTLGQADAALPFLEEGLDLARDLHDEQRTLHALLWLSRIYTNTGNLDRASEEIESARAPRAQPGRRGGALRGRDPHLGYRRS